MTPALDFAFLDTRSDYDARALRSGPLGGLQSSTICLAEALAARGHRVTIYNDRADAFEEKGVAYRPLSQIAAIAPGAIAVSNNNIALLARVPQARHVVWVRSILRLKTVLANRYLGPVLSLRPNTVFPSRFAAQRAPRFLPFRSRRVIEHGVNPVFNRFEPLAAPPPPVAIFASQPRRHLALVMRAWKRVVRPRVPGAELHIYHVRGTLAPKHLDGVEGDDIVIKGAVGKEALAQAMRSARVMIYAGHHTETFSNAAAEAIATGLPFITMGLGPLGERVRHGVDGFIGRTVEDMGAYAAAVMTDDALWRRLHEAGIAVSRTYGWESRVPEWEAAAESWLCK